MRIAIVGAGVSGLGAAYALDAHHEVTIFEQDHRLGGHASTVDVDFYGPTIAVDTGFIIFNRFTYPNLTRLFRELGVRSIATHMGFSVSLDGGRFEWATASLNQIFAQRENLFSPGYYAFLLDILRFFRVARADLAANSVGEVSLADYLRRHRFGPALANYFLLPMGGSIWSASAKQFLEYPAEVLLTFMDNHQLLTIKQPIWLTVEGGSRTYVEKLVATLRATIHKGARVAQVRRRPDGASIVDAEGNERRFDSVILACHSTDAVGLLETPTDLERQVLGAIRYDRNLTVLHGDASFMPKRRNAWASWNYVGSPSSDRESDPVGITYWMNSLQHIDEKYPLFVTLNPRTPPERIFASFEYEHPQYDRAAVVAQKQLQTLQGQGNVWFCGAYAGHGFHEDGFRSGLEVAHKLCERPLNTLLGHPRIFA
jgi:predicted NAD/FAD-binding protein